MEKEVIYNYIKENLNESRFMHTLGVVSTAKKLGGIYGVDLDKIEIAALLHDVCKNMSKKDMIDLIEKNNIELTLNEKRKPELWHSIVGPIIAKEKFNIDDEEILGAIRWHTTGKENMTSLEKIIYIADMIEPSRVFDGVEAIREEVLKDLDKGLLEGMNQTIGFLLSKNSMIDENSIKARNYLLNEMSN